MTVDQIAKQGLIDLRGCFELERDARGASTVSEPRADHVRIEREWVSLSATLECNHDFGAFRETSTRSNERARTGQIDRAGQEDESVLWRVKLELHGD